MVEEFRSKISGFIYGVAMLLIISVNCCNSANNSRYILRQIINKNQEMLIDAETLFHTSFTEHGISEEECNQSLEWFTKPSISNLNGTEKLLKEIDRNLNRFHKAFKDPKNEHTDEYTHKEMITLALSSIEAQRKNVQNYLKRENGVNESGLAIPDRDFYQKKLDCCLLSNNYMEFLRDVNKELKKHDQRRKKRNRAVLVY
ncbi:uncharacterized protein [Aquarana catesbeiana]|uniref:uncharacterized protein isoform X2 n=1 Tax=Aquarana catesbeiana TaxID=8400 RepID=UPI003CC9E641